MNNHNGIMNNGIMNNEKIVKYDTKKIYEKLWI